MGSPVDSAAAPSTPSACQAPAAPGPNMIYTLPSRLQYVASSDNISDPPAATRVGQICGFLQMANDETGEKCWIGITTTQIFSSHWRGTTGPPVLETTEKLKGRVAYEVNVKQRPLQSDYTTDREEVAPTSRHAEVVVGVRGPQCFVEMEKWFTETENFGTGTWRYSGGQGQPQPGEPLFMEVVR